MIGTLLFQSKMLTLSDAKIMCCIMFSECLSFQARVVNHTSQISDRYPTLLTE